MRNQTQAFRGPADAAEGSAKLAVAVHSRTILHLPMTSILRSRGTKWMLDRLKHEVAHLPEAGDRGHLSPAAKDVLRIHTALATVEPGDLSPKALDALADDMAGLYGTLAKAYFG